MCQRDPGAWAMVVGLLGCWVVGEQMDCLRCVGPKIAGRFAAGHGGLAAQVGINCIIIQQLLSKSGNHRGSCNACMQARHAGRSGITVITVLCSEPDVFEDAKESTLKGQSEVSDRYLSEHRAEAAGSLRSWR
jgi:hypothetical protein